LLQNGLNPANLPFFNFEEFGHLPGPRVYRAARNSSTIFRLECPVFSERVIKESKGVNQAAFLVNGNEPSVANSPDKVN